MTVKVNTYLLAAKLSVKNHFESSLLVLQAHNQNSREDGSFKGILQQPGERGGGGGVPVLFYTENSFF